ncbi:MAG TPA: choline ABC transporter substrate-binding protein [Steroidobacteraceae bacterium]|nr:choline ABC transporter substrate-binding protein [Steroidobacteraceae bacterium]
MPWRRLLASACMASLALGTAPAPAASDAPVCRQVRLADVGWTDVTATTAVFSRLLADLGYRPDTTLLAVPVTFAEMKAGNIDVFLGNWMPAQASGLKPYVDDHSIEVVRSNLRGAKYTLAVPAYAYAEGLRDFGDIQRFGPRLHHTIFGIEAGNDGNRHVLDMIRRDEYGLGSFRLVESSEQGMLAQVARAYEARDPVVFLAWEPHPMNMRFELRYLTGGDASFGPNFGSATVYSLTRAGYLGRCPNIAQLLRNLEFTTRGESEVMQAITERRLSPERAASEWLAAHAAIREQWLSGVERLSPLVTRGPGAGGALQRAEQWITGHKLPVGETIRRLTERLTSGQHGALAWISGAGGALVAGVNSALYAIPIPVFIAGIVVLAWLLQRSWRLALFVAAALLFIVSLGYWQLTLETLSLVAVSACVAVGLGVPLGIAAAHRPGLYRAMRPVLDLMQTLPTFVYLIPTLMLFGLGAVPAVIATVLFALPASIHLTQLGISAVPQPMLEAGQAFGATPWQLLWKVEIPSAAPQILAAVTQTIMLSLSMVVICALVGAGGLGVPVVRALNTVQVGVGFEAGLAIVLLAIILDRMTRRRASH